MEDMHQQHEDPTGEASRRAATYLALALAAAQKAIERATRRAEEQAHRLTASTLEPGLTRKTRNGRRDDLAGGAAQPTPNLSTDGRSTSPPEGEQNPAAKAVEVASADSGVALSAPRRYAALIRDVLEPDLAEAVLRDPAWPALATALRSAEHAGIEPDVLLRQVAAERELGSAKHPAQVLNLRLTRRTGTAADLVASSFPTPVHQAPAPAHPGEKSPSVATATHRSATAPSPTWSGRKRS